MLKVPINVCCSLLLVLHFLVDSSFSANVNYETEDTVVVEAGPDREGRIPSKLSTSGYSFLPPVVLFRSEGVLKCITQEGDQGQCTSFKECYPILFAFDEPGKVHNIVLRDEVLATTTPCFAGREERPVPPKIRQDDDRKDEEIICCTTGKNDLFSSSSSSQQQQQNSSQHSTSTKRPHFILKPEAASLSVSSENTSSGSASESEEHIPDVNALSPELLLGPSHHGNRPPIIRQNVTATTEAPPVITSNCGMTKVVNVPAGPGAIAPRNSYPFMAALMSAQRMQFCGASLIDNWHVLTASHCISHYKKPEQVGKILVYLGSHNVYASNEQGREIRKVAKILKHAQYSERTFENDIAILRLDKAVTFSPSIQPLCLNMGGNYEDGKQKAVLAGWGRTSAAGAPSPILRHGTMRVWTNAECQARYKQYFGIQSVPNIAPTMTCAGEPGPGAVDACQGDSGGPLFINPQGRYEQIGIVSWGIGCGLYPGVYTRVAAFLPWIEKNQKLSLKKM